MKMSKNLMKIELKDKIPPGTYVATEVYDFMAMAMEAYLDQLVWNIYQQYRHSDDRKIKGSHVQGAVFYINMIDPKNIPVLSELRGEEE